MYNKFQATEGLTYEYVYKVTNDDIICTKASIRQLNGQAAIMEIIGDGLIDSTFMRDINDFDSGIDSLIDMLESNEINRLP